MIDLLDRVDAWMVRQEQRVVAAMLAVMGLVVFLDVLYRVSATGDSPLVPDAVERALGAAAAPVWAGIVGAVVGILAFRTRGDAASLPKGLAAGVATGVFLAIYVRVLPNGLIWSQTLALSLTLWMGMAGAALAAHQRRHLALDVGSKLWPEKLAPKVAAIGHFVTAAFCLVLLVLGWRSLVGTGTGEAHIPGHFDTWTESGHAAGNMPGTAIPKWAVMASIPFGTLVLAFRFTLEGLKVWTGREALGGDDTLHQLGLDEEVAS